jgi:hypothetical protein
VAVESGLPTDVSVAAGAAFTVTVTGDDNLVGYVSTSVSGGELTVRLPDRINFNDRDHLHIEITAPALTAVAADGAADVVARGLGGDALSLSASGAGTLTAYGSAARIDAHASGAGRVNARMLAAHDAVIHGDGAGELQVCADGRLDLHLSGGSRARYACNPVEVHKDVSGGSSAEAE